MSESPLHPPTLESAKTDSFSPALILPERSHSVGSDLRRRLGADKVKDDFPTITAYSVDASIYKMVPKAVVLAETEDDIAATVAYALETGVPITPRAAGTNLTGSAVGAGIILDCGRMRQILELNVEERWARIQPGLNLTEFNKKLERDGLMFGPDPSSRDMCKLGGMLSNNSAGPHTLRYGSVKDNVHAIRLCVGDGTWLTAEALADGDPATERLVASHLQLAIIAPKTLNLRGRGGRSAPADAAPRLLAELDGDGRPIAAVLQAVKAVCRKYRLCQDPTIAVEKEHHEQLWKARNALYPTLYRYDQKKKPINYVDDVVVSADRIAELVKYLSEFFKGQDVSVAIFGHIGNGNAHIVPLLDLNDPKDFERMVAGYQDIHSTVISRFGGSICGEHGDGRVRAEFVRRAFGEELYDLFKRVKAAFDPKNILNPGVKISANSFTEHIDYVRLSKPCATCAKCNSVCPVYDVFQSEHMSSRGWF